MQASSPIFDRLSARAFTAEAGSKQIWLVDLKLIWLVANLIGWLVWIIWRDTGGKHCSTILVLPVRVFWCSVFGDFFLRSSLVDFPCGLWFPAGLFLAVFLDIPCWLNNGIKACAAPTSVPPTEAATAAAPHLRCKFATLALFHSL